MSIGNRFEAVSEFIKSRFLYEDTVIEFADGKKISLTSLSDVSIISKENALTLNSNLAGYRLELSLNMIEKGVVLVSMTLEAKKHTAPKIRRVSVLKLNSPFSSDTRMLLNGAGFAKDGIVCVSNIENGQKSQHFYSCFDKDNPQNAFTLTTKLPAKFRSEISLEKGEDSISLSLDTIIPHSFEGKINCQEWVISLDMPLCDALLKNARRYSSKKSFKAPIGWSTWDYYFTSATENDVKENVDFIAANKTLSKKVRYIAIDDGWQQREGDWQSGIRYPSGLNALVNYIKRKGFEAGIWIAPTRLHFLCGTVMRRNEFLIKNEYGDPVMDEDMYVLDPTHPDGEAFLRECFAYLAECGFTFYKLDFISNLLKYGDRFYDKKAGPYDALKKLIEIVRQSVPKGSHIMGCSLPYSMGADMVDSRRTGWDIHNTWDHVKLCLGIYLPQFASNEKIYRNDMDYLVVRGTDTSDDPMTNVLNPSQGKYRANPTDAIRWRGGEDFSYTEAKSWCTAMLMTGSSIFMGDNLPLLNQKGIRLLEKTIENADFTSATPIITGDDTIPEIWYKREMKKLYVINFSNEEKAYSVPVGKYFSNDDILYQDIFTNTVFKTDGGFLNFTLAPHDSLCLNPGSPMYREGVADLKR